MIGSASVLAAKSVHSYSLIRYPLEDGNAYIPFLAIGSMSIAREGVSTKIAYHIGDNGIIQHIH